jgi:hypothetical protein
VQTGIVKGRISSIIMRAIERPYGFPWNSSCNDDGGCCWQGQGGANRGN